MENRPLFVAFSNQKGGVGKTTFTVTAASYLHYLQNLNVLVVDCDFPQHSIKAMRQRDMDLVSTDEFYKNLFIEQSKHLNKKAYPIVTTSVEKAMENTVKFMQESEQDYDIVLFDFPGTVNSVGVLQSLAEMDFIFTPIVADRVAMESSLPFASAINENMVGKMGNLKEIYLFWNQVDGREKTELYGLYEKVIAELELKMLKNFIPNTTRYKKELSQEKRTLFRSTLFPPDKRLMQGSNLDNLILEIYELIKK